MVNFFLEHWDVISFYTIVIILLYLFRSKFEFQGIVALFRTKFGVKFMTNTGQRHPKFWNVVGLIAIILGFLGMIFITCYLLWGLYALFFVPNAPPALSPVIPGVSIPGVPITFPLWYTLIALFLAIIVHEGMHGIIASAYNIKIKSSGFAFLGPIPGAFVEPDEKTLAKRSARQQLAIYSAGPFANMVLALISILLVFGLLTVSGALLNEKGVHIDGVEQGSAAMYAGMHNDSTITAIDGSNVANVNDLTSILANKTPGQAILVTADEQQYRVTLGESNTTEGKAYLGVMGVSNETEPKNPSLAWVSSLFQIITSVFIWTYIISLGIGIANLLPIGPVDGGRMFLTALEQKFPKKRAHAIWARWSIIMLFVVLVLVFVPIIKAVFF